MFSEVVLSEQVKAERSCKVAETKCDSGSGQSCIVADGILSAEIRGVAKVVHEQSDPFEGYGYDSPQFGYCNDSAFHHKHCNEKAVINAKIASGDATCRYMISWQGF